MKPITMKNILLPTDFSENAYNALEYAVQFFKNDECTFILLNTFTPVAYNVTSLADSYSTMMIEEISRKNSERGLEEIEKKLKKKYNNPKHVSRSMPHSIYWLVKSRQL